MIWVYNRNEEQIDSIDVDVRFIEPLNNIRTLEFESDRKYEKYFRIVYKDEHSKYYEFIITEIDYHRSDVIRYNYFCEDSFIEHRFSIIEDKKPRGNLQEVLRVALTGSRWEIIDTSFHGVELKNYFYRISSLEAFFKVVENYGIDWRTIYEINNQNGKIDRKLLVGKIGRLTGYRLEIGSNVKNIQRTIINDDVFTALYGFGKGEEILDEEGESTGNYGRRIDFSELNNGKKYIEDNEAKKIFGIGLKNNKKHNFGVCIFEDIEDRKLLLEATKQKLKEVSKIQAEYSIPSASIKKVLIVNNSRINLNLEVGDYIQVIDDEINLREELRIIELIDIGGEVEYKFGNLTKGLSESSISKLSSIDNKIEHTQLETGEAIDSAYKKIVEVSSILDQSLIDSSKEVLLDYKKILDGKLKDLNQEYIKSKIYGDNLAESEGTFLLEEKVEIKEILGPGTYTLEFHSIRNQEIKVFLGDEILELEKVDNKYRKVFQVQNNSSLSIKSDTNVFVSELKLQVGEMEKTIYTRPINYLLEEIKRIENSIKSIDKLLERK